MCLLEASITEVRKVLNKYDEYLRGNETATRVVVIDAVLTALGWDVREPERVRLEHSANKNYIDYVLLSSSGQFLAVVEAKPADTALKGADRRQASGYAVEIGARYAVLTNGGRWEAWEIVEKKPRKENIVVEVNLTTGEIAEIASTLRKLRQEALEQVER